MPQDHEDDEEEEGSRDAGASRPGVNRDLVGLPAAAETVGNPTSMAIQVSTSESATNAATDVRNGVRLDVVLTPSREGAPSRGAPSPRFGPVVGRGRCLLIMPPGRLLVAHRA